MRAPATLPVTSGQVEFEWEHLLGKLRRRSPEVYRRWRETARPAVHPLFRLRAGAIASWERGPR